jgi:hypothetical protein
MGGCDFALLLAEVARSQADGVGCPWAEDPTALPDEGNWSTFACPNPRCPRLRPVGRSQLPPAPLIQRCQTIRRVIFIPRFTEQLTQNQALFQAP